MPVIQASVITVDFLFGSNADITRSEHSSSFAASKAAWCSGSHRKVEFFFSRPRIGMRTFVSFKHQGAS